MLFKTHFFTLGFIVLLIFAVSAWPNQISLICDNNNPDPNEEITVYIHTTAPLFALGAAIYIEGNCEITAAMTEADCNQFGWDNGWNSDAYIDNENGWVYIGGVKWQADANGIVGYFRLRCSGQTSIYFDQQSCDAFSWDGNSSAEVPFSTETLVLGSTEDNIHSAPESSTAQSPKQPISWQLWDFKKTESFETQDTEILQYCDSEDANVIYVSDDITANQIWRSDKTYVITAGINVQALLVIEPGTIIKFRLYEGSMRVNQGGILISAGTPDKPIIYTSEEEFPYFGDYLYAVYIEPTASSASKFVYNYVEYALIGLLIDNNQLDTPIENNFFFHITSAIGQRGTNFTDIINNQIYDCWNDYGYISSGIEIFMESAAGQADANSHILIKNNSIDMQDYGIWIHGTDTQNIGEVEIINNIITGSVECAIDVGDVNTVRTTIAANGYYGNTYNKNRDFEELYPIQSDDFPYQAGPGPEGIRQYYQQRFSSDFLIPYLDANCPFVDSGADRIEDTKFIGTATNVNCIPDSNWTDLGFHHANWRYSNTFDMSAGDLNSDGLIDFNDLSLLTANWLCEVEPNTPGNLNLDGRINFRDFAALTAVWQGAKTTPNITPAICGDANTGFVGIGLDEFPKNTIQVQIFDNGIYVGTIYGLSDNEYVALNVAESANTLHSLKFVSINNNGRVVCSNIYNAVFNCPLMCCVMPSGYVAGSSFDFAAVNPLEADITIELYGDGGDLLWSGIYTGENINCSIPASITGGHYLDYLIITADIEGDPAPVKVPVYPKLKQREFDPLTEALILQPDLFLDLVGTDMLNAVEKAFIQNGIRFQRLGWKYATSHIIALYGTLCPIKYIYLLSHGRHKRIDGSILRTRVKLVDGVAVSVRQDDFPPYCWPSWCEPLEPIYEYSPVLSWAAMGFHCLEFAYFNCCYSGRLKINSLDQLVEGQPGQIGNFDGPHSDMSFALGMVDTVNDRAFQGWYDKPYFMLNGQSPFNKWTVDEWNNLALGEGYSNLDTAIQAAIRGQTSFVDPYDPVNTYRLKGHGLLTGIRLHHE